MDHIWEAPSRLKKTLALIFLKILAIILRQDFLRTLYILDSVLRLSSRYRSRARRNLLHLSLGEMCYALILNINIMSDLETMFLLNYIEDYISLF